MVSASGWEKIEKYTDQTLNWIKYEKGTRKLASDFDSDSKLVYTVRECQNKHQYCRLNSKRKQGEKNPKIKVLFMLQ